MKVAHVILVHKNPEQIVRFLKTLAHEDVDCWIHIDKKFDTLQFRKTLYAPGVYFVEPNIKVDWGCYNTVEAMRISIANILASPKRYDYISFLSGQDYSLKPAKHFLGYLEENKGTEYLGIQPYEVSMQNIIRIRKYHFNGYRFPGKTLFQRIVNRLLPDRRLPFDYEIRKGPQWFTITTNAAEYILTFVEFNPRFVKYFQLVDTPDEFFFQTILYNSDFRSRIRDGVFHYTDWSENKKHPKLLTIKDKKSILDSYYFFARKFDSGIDTEILDILDLEIKKRGQ